MCQQPRIWPSTTKSLRLTSHLLDFQSGQDSASTSYYYSQLAYFSKHFDWAEKNVREKNGHNKPTYCKIRNKVTLQTKTEHKPLQGLVLIKLVKIANLEFYCSLKMGWRPAIWPPTMKYLLLTSHFSDCFSGRGLASVAYNYYSQLVYYSKTFRQGCTGLTNILKARSGRFNVFLFFKRWKSLIADGDLFYLRTRSQHPSLFTLQY